MRKLKLQIENKPNGNTYICQKLPYITEKFLRLDEVVFQAIWKRNISQKCNGNCFFTDRIYRSLGVRKSGTF